MYDLTNGQRPGEVGIKPFNGFVVAVALALLGGLGVSIVFAFAFYAWPFGIAAIIVSVLLMGGYAEGIGYLGDRIVRHNISLALGLSGDDLEEGFAALFPFYRASSGTVHFILIEYRWLDEERWRVMSEGSRSYKPSGKTDFDLSAGHTFIEEAWRSFCEGVREENESRLSTINQTKTLAKNLAEATKNLTIAPGSHGREDVDPPPPGNRSRSSLLAR